MNLQPFNSLNYYSSSPHVGVSKGNDLIMKSKLAMKRQLATGLAITLLVVFGVETMAVASPNLISDSVIAYDKDCPGDDKDDC